MVLVVIGVIMVVIVLVLCCFGLLGWFLVWMWVGDLDYQVFMIGLVELNVLIEDVNVLVVYFVYECVENCCLQGCMMILVEVECVCIVVDLYDDIGLQFFVLQVVVGQVVCYEIDFELVEMLVVIVCYVGVVCNLVCVVIDDLCFGFVEGVSLVEMIQELVIEFQDMVFDIEFGFVCVLDMFILDDVGNIVLYWFVCESVLNVLCYVCLFQVWVWFEYDYGMVFVCVQDDGVGLVFWQWCGQGQIGIVDCVVVLGVIWLLFEWCCGWMMIEFCIFVDRIFVDRLYL